MDAPHESISGYAPDWLLRRLAAAPEPFGEATAETGEAGVLFADISGFTALTERLAQRGGAGVETLIGILNRAFGALITQVYRHGGDILKFAGDALLAVWPAGADGLAEAVARAAECALGMPSLVSGLAVPGETPLSIRVGIGAGPIRLAYVGGLNGRWETLVTGEPLSGLKGAMAQACPGEVVLSPEACFHVGNRASVVPLSDGVVRLQAWRSGSREPVAVAPTVTQAMVPALQGLIPGAVLARLAAGQQRWTAELRTATVIFANLPGLTAGTPLGEAQAIALTLQRVLYRFEGSLNKLSVDEKGVSMVAAFGLPPLTHEDDAVRAVRAARDLQGALLELGVEASVGLATGRVFCGEVGNERRREYTLIGDVVNLAARLMAAAEGDPLIDEATAIAASSRARFEALPPVRLKGKAQPVKVFRLIEVGREPAEPIASLIGRQRERGVLEARLEALARHGEGGVVVIEAEAGVGKSRLVGHLLDRAREREVGWALGAGDAIDRSHAFHAWPQVFASWYGTDPVACRERVLASLDSADHSIVPILQPVLPMNLAETGVTAEMAGETRAANVRRLLGALMAKIARQAPQVVVIEDAHWLDSASWAVALEASRQAGILLVMTTRPLGEAAPLEYHQIVGSAGTRVLPLGAMDPGETRRLVARRLGVDELPDDLASFILDRAEGHPYFSEELAFALREADLIRVEDGRCEVLVDLSDRQAIALPSTIEGVITSRVDRLTPQQQLTLKVASAIGRVFAYPLLEAAYPIEQDRDALLAHLGVLERLDLTPLESPDPVLSYLFKHATTQEAVYNLMLTSQRQGLHRAIADWYEQEFFHDLSAHYSLLAHHWERAANPIKAIDYLGKAGEQALKQGAYREAIAFLGRAIALLAEHGGDRRATARYERLLGEAHFGVGQLSEARHHLERVVALAGWPVPASRLAQGMALLRHAAWQAWTLLVPRRARGGAAGDTTLLEAVRAWERLGPIYLFFNDAPRVLISCLVGLNLAEAVGTPAELSRAYANMAIPAGLLSLRGLSDRYRDKGLAILPGANSLESDIWCRVVLAFLALGIGHWEQVDELGEVALGLAERMGNHRRVGEAQITMGFAQLWSGRWREAEARFSSTWQGARARDDAHVELGALLALASVGIATERIAKMQQHLDLAVSVLPTQHATPESIGVRGIRVRMAALMGESERALHQGKALLDLLRGVMPTAPLAFEGYASLAEAMLLLWEDGESIRQVRPLCRAAMAQLRAFARSFPIAEPRRRLLEGRYRWLLGDVGGATGAWKSAVEVAQRLGMPFEELAARGWLVQRLPATHPDRNAHAERLRELATLLELDPARRATGPFSR